MNAAGRKVLTALIDRANDLQEGLETLAQEVRELADAEREKFDALPETLQQGERGQAIENAATALENAADALELCELGDVATELATAAE